MNKYDSYANAYFYKYINNLYDFSYNVVPRTTNTHILIRVNCVFTPKVISVITPMVIKNACEWRYDIESDDEIFFHFTRGNYYDMPMLRYAQEERDFFNYILDICYPKYRYRLEEELRKEEL